ncbi:MAG: 6-pyruvoyl tetrahydrobiopterin synthase [Candidatus Marinimicrobia bacterium]|nr:6-pyruvoyl tetrahydrobiopterin synthase [Candidatus Neomarinimicrobiota bacterium]|tara:strand:+ start:98 stop:505 length:408 start_codon:yes stop_codon:yes gene_type:complete
MKNLYLTKLFYFNAAHQYGHKDWSDKKNRNVFGPDSKVHGHNYTLEVMVTGEVDDDTGFIVDLGHLKKIVNKYVIDVLDHTQFEKEVEWFKDKQPSSENLAQFIWLQIEPSLKGAKLYRIRLKETPTIFTDYYGK